MDIPIDALVLGIKYGYLDGGNKPNTILRNLKFDVFASDLSLVSRRELSRTKYMKQINNIRLYKLNTKCFYSIAPNGTSQIFVSYEEAYTSLNADQRFLSRAKKTVHGSVVITLTNEELMLLVGLILRNGL